MKAIGVAALSGTLASAGTSAAANAPEKPNIIIIFADDLGYGDLGCFGSETIATPNLDRMASEGMKFTDFHSLAAICSPSRAALMTGRYPRRVGVTAVFTSKSKNGLRLSEVTMAQVLKGAGYATACVGKWHLGHMPEYLPTNRGFDSYFGIPYSNDMGRMRGTGIVDPERNTPVLPLMRGEEVIETEPEQRALTARYTEESIAFIEANKERPFFLYLPHTFPHRPLFASKRFEGKSKGGIYGDVVEELDWSVGEVLNTIKRLGIAEKTLVFFSSDNGPAKATEDIPSAGSAGPLRGHKFSGYEGGIRVPTLMWWPGTVPAGAVCPELTSAMDMLPTVARLAKAELPADLVLDGHDIAPLLTGKPGAKTPYDYLCHFKGRRNGSVRSGQWKMHFKWSKKMEGVELYDLDNDFGEAHNVAAAHPEIVARLQKLGVAKVESFRRK